MSSAGAPDPSATSGGTPDPSPIRAPSVGRAVRVALARGALAFLVVAMVGQLAGLAVAAVSPLRLASFPTVGALEFALMNGVPLVARARLALGGSGSLAPPPASARLELGAALLLGTWLAAWLLYRGGRAAAHALGGEVRFAGVAAGAAVAVPYAVLALVLALLVELRVSTPGALASGSIEIGTVPALLLPLVLGAIAGAAGGLRSAGATRPEDASLRRAEAVLAGGWRMLVLALALSYVGLFAAGIVEPDGPAAWLTPTTGPYLRAVARHPAVGTVVIAHQVAAAPNEAIWTLVPAIGGCDVFSGAGGSHLFACYGRIPVGIARPNLASLLAGPSSLGVRFARAPWPVYLFLLAPGAAAVLAGMWTARRGRARSGTEASALGAGAGIVFAALVALVGWAASVRVALEVTPRLIGPGTYRVGPELTSGAVLALVWGALGGAIGGAIASRSRPISR